MKNRMSVQAGNVISIKKVSAENKLAIHGERFAYSLKRHWVLYLLLLLPLSYLCIFHYAPMYGIQIAFRDFDPSEGFFSGKWIGWKNFGVFFESHIFWRLIRNTLGISLYALAAGFPIPILLAIAINEVQNKAFRKTVQLVTYAPYFISVVILVSIVMQVLSPHTGIINVLFRMLGKEPVNFMGIPQYFKSIYVWSGIWQTAGYSSIIYIAALTSIDLELYEAAIVDGANKIKRIIYIDIPCILPTAVIMLILNAGHLMNVGFEKTYLMQNNMNIIASEVISTYVYKVGLLNGDFSFATAVGLFNSVINLILVILVNQLARKFGDTSLW